jgi:thioredoxin-related protein
MKYIKIILLLCFVNTLYAEEVNFHEGDYASAVEKAKSENKPLLIDAFTVWCGPCKQLDKDVFKDEEAAAYINENFVAYKLDMEKGEGPFVAMKYRVKAYPTTNFISASGHLMTKEIGFPGKSGYLEWCEKVLEGGVAVLRNIDASNLKLEFPDFYKYSFTSDQWKRKRAKADEVNKYLSKQDNLMTEVSWSVIRGMAYTGHDYIKWALDNSDELIKRYPVEEVNDLRQTYIYQVLGKLNGPEPIEEFEKKIVAVVDTIQPVDNERLKQNLFLDTYFRRKEWNRLYDFASAMEEGPNPGLINSISWSVFKAESSSKTLLIRAIKEMEKAIQQEADPNFIDTLAHLYYRTGQVEKAKAQAERAMRLGEESGMEMAESKALLEKING